MILHRRRSNKRHHVLFGISILIVISLAADLGMVLAYHGRALPNTYLGQVNVSGKSFHAISTMSASTILPRTFTFVYGNTRTERTPTQLGLGVIFTAHSSSNTLRRWLPLANAFRRQNLPFSLKLDHAIYQQAAASLATTFIDPAAPTHIVFSNASFRTEPAHNGHQLDIPALATALTDAAVHSDTAITLPVSPLTAPSSHVDLTSDITNLQKQLDTKVVFLYQSHRIAPSKADIGRWYVQDGQSMTVSSAAVASYITNIGRQMNITIANPNSLAAGTTYALEKNLPLSFALIPATSSTLIRTYCTNVRDVSGAVLNELAGKLAATYNDTRGWNDRGHIAFEQVTSGCQYTVWMSASSQMSSFGSICDPYYNCQVGTNVILNYDRWVSGTTPWNNTHGSLEDYRTLMINHETGHRLGFLDNPTCPGSEQSAPVMMQQSIDLKGCMFNIWPIYSEFTQLDTMVGLPTANASANSE